MQIKIIVRDECGNIFRTTTNNPEIAEMELNKHIRMANNCTDYEEECDECEECSNCWEKYPEDYEKDVDEITLEKAIEIIKKLNKNKND